MLVTSIEPVEFHVRSASYNCSATAKVDRYQGYTAASADSIVVEPEWENAHIPMEVDVLRITPNRNSRRSADARVDGVNSAEGVNVNLQIGQCLI